MDEQKEEIKSLPMIESAHAAAERLEKANAEMKENIKKLEELKAISFLGGQTDAGKQPEPPKEETPNEYRKRIEQEIKTGKLR